MKLNILGTDYEFTITTQRDDAGLIDKSGYCDIYAKTIAVEDDYLENDQDCIKNIPAYKALIKRHEILHAFFGQAGLQCYNNDETLVEWLAWNLPAILDVFEQAGCLDEHNN